MEEVDVRRIMLRTHLLSGAVQFGRIALKDIRRTVRRAKSKIVPADIKYAMHSA